MKVEINHLTKVIQGNVVLDDINACFSCASGENGGRIYGRIWQLRHSRRRRMRSLSSVGRESITLDSSAPQ